MAELLGAIIGTSTFYGLICWILQVKKSKKFILAGIITWLFCATIYGLTNIEHFYLRFLIGLFMYLLGSGLWTGLAIYFDKTHKNIKWILKYIPIGTLIGTFVLIFLSILFTKAYQSEKRILVQDEVIQMVAGTRALLGDYDDYSKIDNSTIFAAFGMSNNNPYNGIYTIDAYEQNTKFFIVSIDNVPSSDCKYFLEHKWTDSALYRIDSTKYNGAIATPEDCSDSHNIIQIMFD